MTNVLLSSALIVIDWDRPRQATGGKQHKAYFRRQIFAWGNFILPAGAFVFVQARVLSNSSLPLRFPKRLGLVLERIPSLVSYYCQNTAAKGATLRTEICREYADHCLRKFDWRTSLPLKQQFDPVEVPKLLPYLVMYELPKSGGVLFRLVGTKVVERIDHDPTGMNYLDFVPEKRRAKAYGHLKRMCEHPYGMGVLTRFILDSGKINTVETLGFPFFNPRDESYIVLFAGEQVEEPTYGEESKQKVVYNNILERSFFDLGNGVPLFESLD
ncbi:PAS domain-containing protein [Pelagibius sp. Alg239-R121]|uniref:PAS domain-containing protein n=1 Tax=Pelagibius sp. Alg239-R121 TaxID=2993448 RepID=UPI0024A767BD|nr:PAS domain-containing protein [Pelagibius sp. Alg239-R121]